MSVLPAMLADALATVGARPSASMVLTPQSGNFLPPASEELKHWALYIVVFESMFIDGNKMDNSKL